MIVRERKPAPAQATEEKTRDKILSAAGEVFADLGFEGATIRAITERAGVNVAAVNYHFRDKAELYTRVVLDACSARAAWRDAVADAPTSPEDRLRSLIYHFLKLLLDPARPAWKRRLMVREMANPTEALDQLVEQNIRPLRSEFLLPTLNELTGGYSTARQLDRISVSVMSQCHYYLQCQPILERLIPDYHMDDAEIVEIAEHISQFSLDAIAGFTRRARQT